MQRHYLADIIEPVVDGEGFETVRILTMGETNQTLQIMIEHKDHDKELTVDDCAKVSRAVSAALDEADPIENRYKMCIRDRCKSVTSAPVFSLISAMEPKTSIRGNFGLSDFQTGIGVPQKRLREIDQSRAPSSHLPKRPSLICPGIQLIS